MDTGENSSTGAVKNMGLISQHYLVMVTGRMLPLMALFGTTILFSHSLSQEAYASYQSVWMYVNLVSVIIGFGITTVIFSSQANEFLIFIRENRKAIFPFYTLLWLCTFLIFAMASMQFSVALKLWVIIFMSLQAFNTISETWLIKNGGAVRYCIINVIYAIAFFSWHYLVLVSGFDLEMLVKGIVLFSAGKLITLITFRVRRAQRFHTKVMEVNLFHHWTYNGANDILGVLAKWIDKLILIYLLTPAQFAVFFNGSIEIPLFSILVSFTGSLMMTQMADRLQLKQTVV